MAFKVNEDKIRQAQQEVEERAARMNSMNAPSIKWFKLAGSRAELRILPPWTDQKPFAGQFWRIVHQHWGVTEELKAPILCPKTTPHMDGECPVCDFVDELRKNDDVESREIVNAVRDKQAYLFTVLDMSDMVYTVKDVSEFKKAFPDKDPPFSAGDAKLQVYAAPYTVYKLILGIYHQGCNLVDLDEGHNIVITKEKKGKDASHVGYTVLPQFKPSKISDIVSWDHPLIDLSKAGVALPVAKVKELLDGGIGGDFSAALAAPKENKSLPARAAEAKTKASKEVKTAMAEDEDDEDLALGDDLDDLESQMAAELNG